MNEPREWWVIPDHKILSSNRHHRIFDDEQAKEHQEKWDGEYGMPNNAIRVIDKAAFDALIEIIEQLSKTLEGECCCPGENHWGTTKPILCDPCEAMAASRTALAKMRGERSDR